MDDRTKNAKEELKSLIGRPPWLRGIGIGQDDAGYFIKVNVSESNANLPSEVLGVRVKVDVVGDVMALGELDALIDEFVKLAKKGKQWKKLPKGWDTESRKDYYDSIGGFDGCMEEMEGKMDDPGAFCASLKDRVKGKGWRKKKRKKKPKK